MINYKEKYLKYKKKYLKIRKMFGGSGLPTKKVDTYDKVLLNIENFNSPGAEEKIKKEIQEDDEKLAQMKKNVEEANKKEEQLRLNDERMDIEYDNSANDKVRTQEMEAVRHAVLPLAVLDEIFAKGGLEKTRVKGKYKSNNSNSNKNSLLFGGGILIAAITSVVLLLK
jgi:hypothetical protein